MKHFIPQGNTLITCYGAYMANVNLQMPANPSLSYNGTYSSHSSHQACDKEEPNAIYRVGNVHGKCGNARCPTIQQHHIERALEVSVNKVHGCTPTNNRAPTDVHKMITSLPSSYTRPVNQAKSLRSTRMTLNKKTCGRQRCKRWISHVKADQDFPSSCSGCKADLQ